jgi:hypothetical protein
MGEIVIPYKPREAFLDYHESKKRFSLTVAHRRAGKTVARINKLIKKAVQCEKLNPRFRYIAPYYVQAKDIAWLYLKHYAAPLIQLGGKINESELSVTLPHNNAIIRLYGAENADRLRGTYSDGDVIDEGQDVPKPFLTQIILPSLADREGWLDVSGTPKGWSNLLGELYKMAKNDPDWFVQVLRASETGILPEDELARQRGLMSDNEYQQEFECSFDAAITGAVYGKWIAEAQADGRINNDIEHDPDYPVYTSWDLGFDDATAIWFYQQGTNELLFIDYHEDHGHDIQHYCEVLYGRKIIVDYVNPETKEVEKWHFGDWLPEHEHRKHYTYHDFHFVPHDAANKLQAAGGRSIVEQAKKFGIRMSVIPSTSEGNEIEAGRTTLPKCWFKETECEMGLDALRNWHFPYNEDYRAYHVKARHDWSSHGSKAFGVAARVWRPKVITTKEMKGRAQRNEFFRKRREYNLDPQDPYRVKPMRKK